jgi:copper resistance protein C
MRNRRSMFLPAAVLLLGGFLQGSAQPATLHLALSRAEPAIDGKVTAAPQAISLFFTQAPKAGATAIRLVDSADKAIAVGESKQDAADATIIRAPVTAAVAPGTYQVVWRTMASDGHVVSGDFRFTYAPGS